MCFNLGVRQILENKTCSNDMDITHLGEARSFLISYGA